MNRKSQKNANSDVFSDYLIEKREEREKRSNKIRSNADRSMKDRSFKEIMNSELEQFKNEINESGLNTPLEPLPK